jgi:hypothetical protein
MNVVRASRRRFDTSVLFCFDHAWIAAISFRHQNGAIADLYRNPTKIGN